MRILGFGGNQLATAGGYEVANSLRFNEPSSDKLTRSNGTPTSQQKFTHSVWVKRSTVGNFDIMQGFYSDSNNYCAISFLDSDRLDFINYEGSTTVRKITTAKFRDVSAWYHICVAVDTTQGTANDRVKMYVNGVLQTVFDANTAPSQNANLGVDLSTQAVGVGEGGGIGYLQGYLAESVYIDGQQLDPTSFGEFDSDSGIWKPIDVSGLTFGSAGFYLDFENSGSLGADVSGNGNNFTVNNLTSIDQTTDTPTNNFATFNSLVPQSTGTFSEGNCKNESSNSKNFGAVSTFGVSSGKWYGEFRLNSATGLGRRIVGVIGTLSGDGGLSQHYTYAWYTDTVENQTYSDGTYSNVGWSKYGTGDIVGLALDVDNNKLWFSKNGTFVNGSPSAGTDGFSIGTAPPDGVFYFFTGDVRSVDVATWECNFGNPIRTISSGNSDGNGYGNFEYAVPSGYYALNTKNLSEYG